jgi:Protein of unknown function (DUF805)
MMTSTAAIRNVMIHYAVFRGRASRSEYWWFNLAYSIFGIGALALDHVFRTTLVGLLILLLVVPNLAVTVADCTTRTAPAGGVCLGSFRSAHSRSLFSCACAVTGARTSMDRH